MVGRGTPTMQNLEFRGYRVFLGIKFRDYEYIYIYIYIYIYFFFPL